MESTATKMNKFHTSNREQIQYVHKYTTILNKLSRHLYGVEIPSVNLFERKLVRWLENEPLPQVIRRVKEMRLMVLRFISGSPISSPFLRSSKGLPSAIPSQLRNGIRTGDTVAIKITLSLLYISREWKCELNPNYDAITVPNEPDIQTITGLIPQFIRDHNLKADTDPWTLFHLSTKQGPNGPALAWSLKESQALPDSLVSQITTLSSEVGEALTACRGYLSDQTLPEMEIRKVTPIQDKEGKTRIIGILDYWSQTALKPFHDSLMGCLGRFKSDMTRNQTGHGHDWSRGMKLFSFDLVSATDRFPLNLQSALVKGLIGEEKGQAWADIMTAYEFKSPIGKLTYKAGQPMGAYSSWAVFTLCHHYIMYIALNEVQEGHYIMLGDDIVIAGEKLARKYQSIITMLGVEISEPKSFESQDFYEFAKKCYYKGVDVTPLHIGAVLTARGSTEWISAMSTLTERNSYRWPGDLMLDLAHITLGNLPDWKIRSALGKLYAFDQWPLNQDGTPNHKLIEFVRRVIPVSCGSHSIAERKLAAALKGTLQNALIEQVNNLENWFTGLKEHRIAEEDWANLNLPGVPSEMVPLEVIYEREKNKFRSLIMKLTQDTLFLGLEGFSEITKIVLSDPRKLGSVRRHLVSIQMTTHLSQKVLTTLQKLRDRDVSFPIQPLQVEFENSPHDDGDF